MNYFKAYKEKLIKPMNYKTFKLENASEALQYLLERKNIGKLVLKVN